MGTWNRRQLWSERDAGRVRTARVHALLAAAAIGALVGWGALTHLSCAELYYVDEYTRVPATPAREQCTRDDDCVLVPSLITCCGECQPAPPFEAVPLGRLASRRTAASEMCLPSTRGCEPPVCPAVIQGCEVRAICAAGSCAVEASERCLPR